MEIKTNLQSFDLIKIFLVSNYVFVLALDHHERVFKSALESENTEATNCSICPNARSVHIHRQTNRHQVIFPNIAIILPKLLFVFIRKRLWRKRFLKGTQQITYVQDEDPTSLLGCS
jgi:hypothetical protein